MCGITGMYLFKRNDLLRDYFSKCLITMRHRGPDSQCLWDNSQNYIAGFCRLAIRDLSAAGNQPMLSDCGQYCLSFNGEIYNVDELKNALKPYRTEFNSTSDTEALLYCLMHLGAKKTFEITDGIFAIAFYDRQKNSLLLARDRLGIKPLYIGQSSGGIVYSSQYDHVINHPFIKSETISTAAIGSFLSLGYVPENSGAVNNTRLLLHGHYYLIENEAISQHRYYNYPLTQTKSAGASLDDTLYQSVQKQLISDVPIGTFMSGGVDSTLVTYFASRQTHVNSFTIGIKGHELDESQAAGEFADIFQTNHHCKFITSNDLVSLLPENTKAFSEPFADFSSLPALMLSSFAKEKVTVALSGDGGDELFWGYQRNMTALKNIHLYTKSIVGRKITLLKRKVLNSAKTNLSRHWNEKDFLSYYYHALFIAGSRYLLPRVFKEEALEDYYYSQLKNDNNKPVGEDGYMNMVRKLETEIHLQRILLKVDRTGMYHSLEVRVPLLSNNVLDISSTYGYKECINGGVGKINLKKSLINKTNERLVMQPKKGFMIPMAEWMRTDLKAQVYEKIMQMPAPYYEMFNKPQLESMLKEHMSGEKDWSWFIWAIYSLINWDEYHRNSKTLSV